ncbi:MAG: hypothetical protein ABL907_00445 [Hyphomicrobium sp.]
MGVFAKSGDADKSAGRSEASRSEASQSHDAGPRRRIRFAFIRPAIDAAAALALFMFATMTLASAPTSANPHNFGTPPPISSPAALAIGEAGRPPIVEIATTSSPQAADAVYRRTSSAAAWVLLSLAFSLVAALNMAFLRHMRHAYANPRSRPRE